jgi:hypothetical protein
MVAPLASAEEAREAIQTYEALKRAIQQPSDVFEYNGRPFLKKAFWRRIAACFGLSLELVSEEREQDENANLAYSVYYRAIAPNGRTMIGDGYCSRSENGHGSWPEHTVRATAHTRAKNRAISDMVGGGEVSAEEVDYDREAAPSAPKRLPAKKPALTVVEERRYPEMDDRLISEASRKAAGALGITGDDYAKAFAAQVNDGRPIEPAQITRKQREDWYAYLDKQLAATEFQEEDAPISFDLGALDPHDVKVS